MWWCHLLVVALFEHLLEPEVGPLKGVVEALCRVWHVGDLWRVRVRTRVRLRLRLRLRLGVRVSEAEAEAWVSLDDHASEAMVRAVVRVRVRRRLRHGLSLTLMTMQARHCCSAALIVRDAAAKTGTPSARLAASAWVRGGTLLTSPGLSGICNEADTVGTLSSITLNSLRVAVLLTRGLERATREQSNGDELLQGESRQMGTVW
jgi:hypothetical protein